MPASHQNPWEEAHVFRSAFTFTSARRVGWVHTYKDLDKSELDLGTARSDSLG